MRAELVSEARKGDREAFASLAAGVIDRLYTTARLLLRDTGLAEDAVQESLVRAWRDLPMLRDIGRFDAWLYRLLVHSCTDIARDRRRWRTQLTLITPEPSESDRVSDLADRDQLERGLRRLTDAQRTILVLHFYLDLSMRDMAEALEIPVGTVKSRLHHALEAMRAALEADKRSVLAAVGDERRR